MMTSQITTQSCAGMALAPLAVIMIAVSAAAQNIPENIVKWSLSLEQPSPHKAGSTFNVRLHAKIEDGWHLYSLDQREDGPKPTRITVLPNQTFELAGEIESPVPIIEMDENFGFETEFYEESATFTLPLRVVANTSAGQHTLQVQVRYQTCTQRLCLPSKTAKLEMAFEVVGN